MTSKFQKFDTMQFYCPEDFFDFFSLQANVKDTYISIGFSPLRAVEVRSAQENTAVVSVYTIHLSYTFFFFFKNKNKTESYVDFYSQLCLD